VPSAGLLAGNSTKSGTLTFRAVAGLPEAMSTIALPGMSRIARITSIEDQGGSLHIIGTVDDRSQLQRDESPEFNAFIDRTSGIIRAEFFGKEVSLLLEN
jgi:hypothetical protein